MSVSVLGNLLKLGARVALHASCSCRVCQLDAYSKSSQGIAGVYKISIGPSLLPCPTQDLAKWPGSKPIPTCLGLELREFALMTHLPQRQVQIHPGPELIQGLSRGRCVGDADSGEELGHTPRFSPQSKERACKRTFLLLPVSTRGGDVDVAVVFSTKSEARSLGYGQGNSLLDSAVSIYLHDARAVPEC